jgi:Holliday junction DNA helicase RuvA
LIGRLTGRVVDESADGTVVLDVHGVGYDVVLPIGSLGRLLASAPGGAAAAPRPANPEVTIFVHTHVREDALSLFGFGTREDRAAFRALIGVSSIGPKIAMAVLSALPGPDLSLTVGRGDVAKLTKIPGIGKRTAERIVLELKEKLPVVVGAAPAGAETSAAPARGGQAALVERALVEMGFRPPEAERATAALGDKVDTAPLPELVRLALAHLVR